MQELVFIFNKADVASLGKVRCTAGLLAAVKDDSIWLRGVMDLPDMDIKIKQLPAKQTFYIDENELLFAPGTVTPVDQMPQLDWQPLNSFLPVEIPVAALPGQVTALAKIQLIPSENSQAGSALLTSLQVWKSYAETAPGSRLQRLRFAVAADNEVLIMGNPLPPLPGKEYWSCNNILLPNGYQFEIPMMANFINEKFNAQHQSVLLFDVDGSWQLIDNNFFVPAKRSAVRLTEINE
jgi:hypothetical protein